MGQLLALPSAPFALAGRLGPTPNQSTPGIEFAKIQSNVLDPPCMGALPSTSKKRALLLSGFIYGALFAGAMGLTLSRTTSVPSRRTVAFALDAYDAVPAPPPPAITAARAGTSRSNPAQQDSSSTPHPADEFQPKVFAPQNPSAPPSSSHEPAGGGNQAGQAGGVAGGVPGGQTGGTVGGQLSGVVAPRFDAAYLNNPEPDYPSLSKRLGEEGRVLLRVLVTAEGFAELVEIRQTSGHPRLDQAALTTVKRWRFTPARRGDERLAAWVLVPLSFQLEA